MSNIDNILKFARGDEKTLLNKKTIIFVSVSALALFLIFKKVKKNV
jgi:hypothetical protein